MAGCDEARDVDLTLAVPGFLHEWTTSSLPFALVESTGWGTILIVTFIAYGLLGVVQNAAELENPFGTGRCISLDLLSAAEQRHGARRSAVESHI